MISSHNILLLGRKRLDKEQSILKVSVIQDNGDGRLCENPEHLFALLAGPSHLPERANIWH